MKRKVCVVINSRANYARIKSVLVELKNRSDCELQIVVGASGLLFRFGKVIEIIKKDGFSVNREVYSVVEGNDPVVMAKTTGLALIELSQVFFDLKPDVVVTIADRHETLATAIASSYMNIPVAHTQGGEITGSIDESVRHACTKLSHLHFPATKNAYNIILQLGEEVSRVHLTGCPSLDLVEDNKNKEINVILDKHLRDSSIFKNKSYLLVLFHADTQHYEESSATVLAILRTIQEMDIPVIWLWPNVDAGTDLISKELRRFRDLNPNSKIQFVRNFSPEDFITILNNASCIIGNSSSGIREASRTGTPSVVIGTRQNGREFGDNVIYLPSFDLDLINKAVQKQIEHGSYNPSLLYGDGYAGKRIAEILCTANLKIEKNFVKFEKLK
jgi:UDP-hydrolysing UDP-N-acetyl-D-glucosamine 2-epimerase